MSTSDDRDRQQRELTEELRHDADLRAERKRLKEEYQRDAAQTEEHIVPGDQRQPSGDQALSAKEVCAWARDLAR
jgi:hypothetical protein